MHAAGWLAFEGFGISNAPTGTGEGDAFAGAISLTARKLDVLSIAFVPVSAVAAVAGGPASPPWRKGSVFVPCLTYTVNFERHVQAEPVICRVPACEVVEAGLALSRGRDGGSHSASTRVCAGAVPSARGDDCAPSAEAINCPL